MTDPTATIERLLGDHLGSGSRWENETWTQACTCGWVTQGHATTIDATQARRTHVAAVIVKALGLARETRIDTRAAALWSATVPVSPDVVARLVRPEERYATPWVPRQAAQEPRSRPNEADGHTGKGQTETSA